MKCQVSGFTYHVSVIMCLLRRNIIHFRPYPNTVYTDMAQNMWLPSTQFVKRTSVSPLLILMKKSDKKRHSVPAVDPDRGGPRNVVSKNASCD